MSGQHPGLRAVVVLALAVIGLLGGGNAAGAFWTAGGSGANTAAAGSLSTVTIAAFIGGDSPSSTLVPGGSADVILRVNNPNSLPVRLISVTANGPVTADPAHPGCTTTGVMFTAPPSPLSPTITVPAASSRLVHLAGAAAMDLTSQSACQGASFHLPVTLSAQQ